MSTESDVFCVRDGEILCINGPSIHLARRESEMVQVLATQWGHFVSWQEVARRMFAVTDETRDEAAIVRSFASLVKRKIDGKCSFGIEGKSGYGYRLFGRLLIDDHPPVAGAAD